MRHRVAPHALVDLLALQHLPLGLGEQLDELEFAPREIDGAPADEGLELVRADLHLAGDHGPRVDSGLGALAPPHHGLDPGDQLLRMAGLGHPVVRPQAQPAHPLRDRRRPRAHDHAQPRQRGAQPLQVRPPLRPQRREIDDDRVEPHGHHRVERDRRGQDAMLPAHGVEPLGQDLQEARISVENRKADRRSARRCGPPLVSGAAGRRLGRSGHRSASLSLEPVTERSRGAPDHGFFTTRLRGNGSRARGSPTKRLRATGSGSRRPAGPPSGRTPGAPTTRPRAGAKPPAHRPAHPPPTCADRPRGSSPRARTRAPRAQDSAPTHSDGPKNYHAIWRARRHRYSATAIVARHEEHVEDVLVNVLYARALLALGGRFATPAQRIVQTLLERSWDPDAALFWDLAGGPSARSASRPGPRRAAVRDVRARSRPPRSTSTRALASPPRGDFGGPRAFPAPSRWAEPAPVGLEPGFHEWRRPSESVGEGLR